MSYHFIHPEKKVKYGATDTVYLGNIERCNNVDSRNSFMYIYDCYVNLYYIFCVDIKKYTLIFTYKYDYNDNHIVDIDEHVWENFLERFYRNDTGYKTEKKEKELLYQGITKQTLEDNIVKVAGI